MTRRSHRRLMVPAVAAVGGSAISLSVGLGRGNLAALLIGEAATVVAVVVLYATAARDSDLGAVLGGHADERQELVRLKASRVSAVVAITGSVVATVIAAAINATYWPFEVLYIVPGLAYVISVRVYGTRDRINGADDDDLDS